MIREQINKLDKAVFFLSTGVVILITVLLLVYPDASRILVSNLMAFMTYKLGFLYIITYIVIVVFLIWLSFGRFGKVVLGKPGEKPEYSDFSWMAMMFCTGIACGLMIFSFIEPIYYLTATPFNIEPMSVKAFEYAHMYGQFHWGPSAWLFYTPVTIAIAYKLFARDGDSIRLGDVCKDSRFVTGWMGKIIDVFTVFAVLGGIGTSMGLAAPLCCQIASSVFGIPNDTKLMLGIYILWFCIFATSVWRGLDKGIKVLSNINIYMAVAFIIVIMIIAGVTRVIDVELNSIGLYFTEFFHMSFNTDPFGKSGFPQDWTIFYWGWWLSYIPIMGLFTARISRGRTIRSTILGMIGYGSLGCILSFASLGCYSLDLQMNGVLDVAGILAESGKDAAVMAILETLPFSKFAALLFGAISIIFMATTIDSSAYTLASVTTAHLKGNEQPARWNRLLWAIIFVTFAIALTRIGGLQTMQTASVLTGLPMIFVCGVTFVVLYNMLKEDHPKEK
ncbi:MAG: BCCT family transporter [Clostridiales bacterium]|nr:BCCT family transporter [Clostridiales bacterium]MBR0469344.1 BCCT family transporter [Mogibacterium sp.]